MAEEAYLFSFDDVAQTIADKMIHRHPHVFGDRTYSSEEEQQRIGTGSSPRKSRQARRQTQGGFAMESGDPRPPCGIRRRAFLR